MSWADPAPGWTPRSRPARPKYVPTGLRTGRFSSTTNQYRSNPSGSMSGRGGGFRRHYDYNNSNRSSDPFDDVEEKFDELEVIGEDSGGGGINFDAYDGIPVEATGADVPPPANSFAEIDLGEAVIANIVRCKYSKPTPVQRHAIPILVAGRDLMACAQTGSGKTAAFCFPIISGIAGSRHAAGGRGGGGGAVAHPLALILSPTRELSCQTYEEARKFSYQTGVKIAVAYGGAPISQQLQNFKKGVDILVATPGRLVDMIERQKVSLKMIRYLALDEADRMLDMGFEPQIRKIVERMDMPPPGSRQTLLFSATFPVEIQQLASDFLSNYIFLSVGRVGSSTDLIAQKVEFVQEMDKKNFLMGLLRGQSANGSSRKLALTLIFVETKRGADALERWLSRKGFPAIAIHGDKVQMERERALKSFKSGATPVLVATDVASRGLDVPHVAHVINFDLPKDIDDYVHRIGRTGRAGKSGLATAFFSDKNMPLAKSLAELMQEANQEVPSWLTQYAESNSGYNSAGRSRRYGGNKFGGRDFRSNNHTQYRNGDNYNYSASYGGDMDSYATQGAFSNAFPADTGYTTSSAYYHASGAHEHTYDYGNDVDYGTIVATGWE